MNEITDYQRGQRDMQRHLRKKLPDCVNTLYVTLMEYRTIGVYFRVDWDEVENVAYVTATDGFDTITRECTLKRASRMAEILMHFFGLSCAIQFPEW